MGRRKEEEKDEHFGRRRASSSAASRAKIERKIARGILSLALSCCAHLSTRSKARFCVARPEPSLRPLELRSEPAAEPGRARAAATGVVAAAAAAAASMPPSRLAGRGAATADICACFLWGDRFGEVVLSLCATRGALYKWREQERAREEKEKRRRGSKVKEKQHLLELRF